MSLFMVRAGRYGEHEASSIEDGALCIGYPEVPDLRRETTREAVQELVERMYPDEPAQRRRNAVTDLFLFAHEMKEGDLVVLPFRDKAQVAIGKVQGNYWFQIGSGHERPVKWLRTDVSRTQLGADLLQQFCGAMRVCYCERKNAEERLRQIAEGQPDPGAEEPEDKKRIKPPVVIEPPPEESLDVEQAARDQVMRHIQQQFRGHDLTRLVEAVLQAEGYTTHRSPPGPDGGVDILAAKGPLGLDSPRLCVQVKSSVAPCDVTVLRSLGGTMAAFKAEQGLLVSWGGFNSAVEREARTSHFFSMRLWDASNLVEALQRNYDRLSEEIRGELPLKRIWALVLEE